LAEYNPSQMDPLSVDFLKDRYDFELERKEKLTDALTLPIGVLSAPPPSAPQKPAFPQSREVREGAYGPKTEIK
jgi:hypothetical protein